MCSNLQKAMEDLIRVFYCYSGKEGDKYKLNKKELKNMLQEELGDFLNVSNFFPPQHLSLIMVLNVLT